MSGVGGFVEDALDSGLLQRFSVGLAGGAPFLTAPVADEDDLDSFLEPGHVGNIRRRDVAAAEDADMGELVEIGHGDPLLVNPIAQ